MLLLTNGCLSHDNLCVTYWPHGGKKIREHPFFKNILANTFIVHLTYSDCFLSRVDETCTLLNLVVEPGHTLFHQMRDLVGCFFVPNYSFQIRNTIWFPTVTANSNSCGLCLN